MAKLSHRVEYVLALAGVTAAQAMPARLADLFGAGLGDLACLLLASRRRIARENLRRAMGESLSEREIRGIVRKTFQNTGRTVVEFSRLGKTFATVQQVVHLVSGREHLDRVHAEGRGGILVSGHSGSWELGGAFMASLGYPMDFLTGVQHNELVDGLLNGFRQHLGVGLIPISKGVKGVFRSLRAGRFVVLLSDQHAPAGVVVSFFGRPAATPKGPAAFAVKAGAPILPAMSRRVAWDRHEVVIGSPIYPPDSGDTERDIVTLTQAYTDVFEACIREYPDQWLWTHRRWKV